MGNGSGCRPISRASSMRFCRARGLLNHCFLRRDLKTALHSQGREAMYDLTVQLSTK